MTPKVQRKITNSKQFSILKINFLKEAKKSYQIKKNKK